MIDTCVQRCLSLRPK